MKPVAPLCLYYPGRKTPSAAFKEFIADVNTGAYPQPQHNVAMQDAEFEAFKAALGQ